MATRAMLFDRLVKALDEANEMCWQLRGRLNTSDMLDESTDVGTVGLIEEHEALVTEAKATGLLDKENSK